MFKTFSQSLLASKSLEARRLLIAQLRYLQLTSAIHADDTKEKIEPSKDVKDVTSASKVSKVAPAKKETIKGKEIIEEPNSVKKGQVSLNENLRKAAVRVARSLPGDWTRTADELLTRLQMHSNPENIGDQETSEEKPSSLLSTMKVSRLSMPSRQRVHEDRQRIRETSDKWDNELPYTTTAKGKLVYLKYVSIFRGN
ncbi:unnamed protein product [Lymnaea stagnalis]|uniref:Uncharacterized protein n=1 Tax=Lymnaea stagnalis TaxID=6523 RepID=A0AAV2IBC8_LYMST